MLCSKFLSANNPQKPLGAWGCSKFKKAILSVIVVIVILSISCISVSATSSVTYGNVTFSCPSFRTYVKDWGYSEPADTVTTQYSVGNDGIYEFTAESLGDYFGGNTTYYRCMRGMISLPYSDSNRQLIFKVTPSVSLNGVALSASNYDISLGDKTYFSNGGVTDNPFFEYSAVRDSVDGSIVFTVDIGNYDDFYFQISTLVYSDWHYLTYYFSSMSIVSDDGTQDIINNQNSNTDREIQADKENTQAIIDNQNELAEKEKNEINSSGNDSVDESLEIMPNTDSFFGVFDGFIDCITHTDTECYFTIPEIYIPAIDGLCPKVVLYSGSDYRLNDIFEMIPILIMELIQAALTLALIIYAFKELWSLIGAFLGGANKVGTDLSKE